MANNATLGDLHTQVLDLADDQGGFATAARVYEYINLALSELWDILVTNYEHYGRSLDTVTLVSGTESYNLPTDYLKTLKVFATSAGKRYKLPRFTLEELDRYQDDVEAVRADGSNLRYAIIGKLIWFTPTPTGGTVEHWYVPQSPQFDVTNASDVIDSIFPIGWEDFVITAAAERLLIREERDPSGCSLLHQRAHQRIVSAAAIRDAGEPLRITDTSGRWGSSWR